jgi:elongation factor Ts
MSITAGLVKELRERTGAAMMECKKALVASQGDIEAAIEAMRASGQAKAVKKAGRVTAEGKVLVKLSDDGGKAVILEVNCETDFVAKDENFIGFTDAAVAAALASGANDVETLMAQANLETARAELISKIGENIQVRRVASVETDKTLAHYLHGLKIGVLVTLDGGDAELAKDVAMHIAAVKPEVISPEEVSAERVEKEKKFLTEQALESGKPAEVVDKMIQGRMKKFLNEISLLGQDFVKDPSQTVAQLLKKHNAKVANFIRYEVGEGIEKKEDNFAQEVMAQVKGSE